MTLVELLVVISILGILAALLFPALNAARASSRRAACQNNLKQFFIGMAAHADRYGTYCCGAFDWNRDGCATEVGWVADLVNTGTPTGKMLCPSNPAQISEAYNDLLGLDAAHLDPCVDHVGSRPSTAPDGTPVVNPCRLIVETPLAASSEPRRQLVEERVYDEFYNTNYTASWFLVRSGVRLDGNGNLASAGAGCEVSLKARGCTYGPLLQSRVDAWFVSSSLVPLLGCGATSGVLSQTIGPHEAGVPVAKSFTNGPVLDPTMEPPSLPAGTLRTGPDGWGHFAFLRVAMKRRHRMPVRISACLVLGGLIWFVAHRALAPTAQTSHPGDGSAPRRVKLPRAVVEKPTHHFGILDPDEKCEHTFIIRNEGEAPLELARVGTSCKCTVSDLPEEPIPPGGQAAVRIASKRSQKHGKFSHSAVIATNDPAHQRITLRIEGMIRSYVAADPPRIVLSGVRRDKPSSAEMTVYSQVWESFTIGEVTSSLEGLKWQIEPADSEVLSKLDARSGYRLDLTVPPSLPGGRFWERLEMSIQPGDPSAAPRDLGVAITGTVLARISIHSPKMGAGKLLQLGTIRRGEGLRERLMMKVRDDHPELVVQRVETKPDFLHASVSPFNEGAQKLGLYKIDVEVPSDAPPGNFLSDKGEIRIVTDHPQIPVLTLRVAFAVTSG